MAAALRSRSMTSPQTPQRTVRVPNAICCAALPQAEQILVEGNQRSQTTSSAPARLSCSKLAGELGPGGVRDGPGEALVAKQVGYRKILDGPSPL